MNSEAATVVACLTPPGAAGLATLGLHGPAAWDACRELFSPRSGQLPNESTDVRPGTFWLGRLGDAMKDDAVLTLRAVEPMPCVELHCHGGRQLVTMLVELFERRGLRVCSWEEWLRRTSGSALQAEAAVSLAQASTPRTAAILLDQYHGSFERELNRTRAAIQSGNADAARELLTALCQWSNVGRHLTRPWRVAVLGSPNVGKSSLVNALAGYQRSIVSEVPGTTRDVVSTLLALDGWPVELLDTAGLREEATDLESQGIRLARGAAREADLCLLVVGADVAPVWPNTSASLALKVVNKIDLPTAWDLDAETAVHRVSARTGEGIGTLCETLARALVPESPPPGAAIPFTPRWCDRVDEARRLCEVGRLDEALDELDE